MPAIAAAGYTAVTVNNSFDKNLHGLIGFLDSPVSIKDDEVSHQKSKSGSTNTTFSC